MPSQQRGQLLTTATEQLGVVRDAALQWWEQPAGNQAAAQEAGIEAGAGSPAGADDSWWSTIQGIASTAVQGAQELADQGQETAWSASEEVISRGTAALSQAYESLWGRRMPAPGQAPEHARPSQDLPMPEIEKDELQELMAQERLDQEQVARARELIAELPDEAVRSHMFLELQGKVIYRNQRNNASASEKSTGGTCNLTALAMCLEYLGVANPDPARQFEDALDQIRIDNKYGSITSGATWEKIAAHLGRSMAFQEGGVHDRAWWQATMRDTWLGSGWGVLASIHGHVVRIQGVTDEGVVVDDPYGASTLKPSAKGTDKRYGWEGINETEHDGTQTGNVGEDHIWPWSAAEGFDFKYFAVVS